MAKISIRSCLFCRESGAKAGLLRFVFADGRLVFDPEQGRPGRGAYVHPRLECLSRMAAPARFEKALRLPSGAISVAELKTLAGAVRELASVAQREPPAGAQPVGAPGKLLRRKL